MVECDQLSGNGNVGHLGDCRRGDGHRTTTLVRENCPLLSSSSEPRRSAFIWLLRALQWPIFCSLNDCAAFCLMTYTWCHHRGARAFGAVSTVPLPPSDRNNRCIKIKPARRFGFYLILFEKYFFSHFSAWNSGAPAHGGAEGPIFKTS